MPDHTDVSCSLSNPLAQRLSVGFTAQTSLTTLLLDKLQYFRAHSHWNYPRKVSGEIRYRFDF